MASFKFTLFADAHYKKGMYATTVEDLRTIFCRAAETKSEAVLHAGDMCNDYLNSPEFVNAYLKNSFGLPVYGVYGNHELEGPNNSMDKVTPLLTNDKKVVWGTEDGRLGDGQVAYYHVDKGDFRIIGTDTNYSFNPVTGEWQHNTTRSYGPPKGNLYENSLGPVQFAWLEKLLIASAKEGKKCIILSHASYTEEINHGTPDHVAVQQLFARVNAIKKGTVLIAINGHYHTNRALKKEGVVYLDMNTTRNCWWQMEKAPHYTDGQGQYIEELDEQGNTIGQKWQNYTELWMSPNTWFSKDALSAVVTVTDGGDVTVEGTESEWAYGIAPKKIQDVSEPRVSSVEFKAEQE